MCAFFVSDICLCHVHPFEPLKLGHMDPLYAESF
jgi:hypothetical protein